jgi:TolA-binding protein
MLRFAAVLVFLIAIAGCGKPTAEESFAAAEEAQKAAEAALGSSPEVQDSLFLLAIDTYEQILENDPEHPLAEIALFRIAELHNNGTRRFPDAIDAYRRFLVMYRGSPQAPVSLFMIGFLYNNELRQTDSAAAAYRQFLQEFGGHELAASARAELDNLGKSPEQIIEQQLASIKAEEGGQTEKKK